MALITISGYPCSGKTTRALEIQTAFEERIKNPEYGGPIKAVKLISDETLELSRNGYDDGRMEKPQRGALFSAIQRNLNSDTIVIADGLNYIKGFRYQMYCLAREVSARVATVFIATPPETCRNWHLQRAEDKRYTESTFDNLIQRYEEPSSMVRWDSPLFTVPWTEDQPPTEEIWQAVTAGVLKPPNAGTSGAPKPPTDALQALESTAAACVSAIMSSQAGSPSCGGSVTIWSGGGRPVVVEMPDRTVTLSELQRLKRQFVTIHKKAITQGATENGDVDWSEGAIAAKFGNYLEGRLTSGV